jgi:hypothetical protein
MDSKNFMPMSSKNGPQPETNKVNRSFAEEVERENSVNEFKAGKRSRAGSRAGGERDSEHRRNETMSSIGRNKEDMNQSIHELANVFDNIDPINPSSNQKMLNESGFLAE